MRQLVTVEAILKRWNIFKGFPWQHSLLVSKSGIRD